MPVSLLVALLLAFGLEPSSGRAPMLPGDLVRRVLEVGGWLLLMAVLSFALGQGVTRSLAGGSPWATWLRRRYARGQDALVLLSLLIFAWIIHGLGWPEVVRGGFGLRGAILA